VKSVVDRLLVLGAHPKPTSYARGQRFQQVLGELPTDVRAVRRVVQFLLPARDLEDDAGRRGGTGNQAMVSRAIASRIGENCDGWVIT